MGNSGGGRVVSLPQGRPGPSGKKFTQPAKRRGAGGGREEHDGRGRQRRVSPPSVKKKRMGAGPDRGRRVGLKGGKRKASDQEMERKKKKKIMLGGIPLTRGAQKTKIVLK